MNDNKNLDEYNSKMMMELLKSNENNLNISSNEKEKMFEQFILFQKFMSMNNMINNNNNNNKNEEIKKKIII